MTARRNFHQAPEFSYKLCSYQYPFAPAMTLHSHHTSGTRPDNPVFTPTALGRAASLYLRRATRRPELAIHVCFCRINPRTLPLCSTSTGNLELISRSYLSPGTSCSCSQLRSTRNVVSGASFSF